MSIRRRAGSTPVDTSPIKRWFEARIIPAQALADGNNEVSPLSGVARFGQSGLVAANVAIGSVNGGTPILRVLDGRRCLRFVPTIAQNSLVAVQLNQGGFGLTHFLDFADVFPGLTSPVGGGVTFPPSWSVSAWVRKSLAGDGSDCQSVVGFATTSVTGGATKQIPRVGLIGDGAGGYRYGSVNCPDGAAAGNNVATDVDANASQPTDLVAPGTNWWHSRIKLIPPIATQPGRIACYHNGVLRTTFTTVANFPRGHQAVNDTFNRLQLVIGTYFNAGGVVPSPVLFDIRLVAEDDYTV